MRIMAVKRSFQPNFTAAQPPIFIVAQIFAR
jgi:hypothetical protein